MRFIKLLLFINLIIIFVSCRQSPSVKDEKTYRIGYMICNSEEETLHRFRPLTAYLAKKLGVKAEAAAIDTTNFTKEIDNLDFTHTNSLLYIILNRYHGVRALTADKQGSLGSKSNGAIVTRKDSGINTIKDLKGKSMVFGPMLAPTGYLQQYDLMIQSGVDPEDDLSFYTIPTGTYKHEKVIYGVLYGMYDAGAFQMLDFERMIEEGRINRDDFKIIAEGEPIPYCTFGSSQKIDAVLANTLKKALLELKKEDTVEIDGETVKVLARARLDGFEDVKDEDYNIVRDIARRANMPPYQKY
ncbi:MAG: phosphate/phosphite/phosphonate ABC transporter substrate-binding protein [Nitrospirae bacterium]|nr:phosphate/phosphite/phosphonate ABC transporter substrate-binding protein [Nitrospirota bacterium]